MIGFAHVSPNAVRVIMDRTRFTPVIARNKDDLKDHPLDKSEDIRSKVVLVHSILALKELDLDDFDSVAVFDSIDALSIVDGMNILDSEQIDDGSWRIKRITPRMVNSAFASGMGEPPTNDQIKSVVDLFEGVDDIRSEGTPDKPLRGKARKLAEAEAAASAAAELEEIEEAEAAFDDDELEDADLAAEVEAVAEPGESVETPTGGPFTTLVTLAIAGLDDPAAARALVAKYQAGLLGSRSFTSQARKLGLASAGNYKDLKKFMDGKPGERIFASFYYLCKTSEDAATIASKVGADLSDVNLIVGEVAPDSDHEFAYEPSIKL